MSKTFLTLFILLTCLSCQVFAAADSEQTEPVVTPKSDDAGSTSNAPAIKLKKPKSLEYFYQADVAHYFNPDEVKTLLAGDTEFNVLFQDDMTGRPRGVALLIPDWSQGASSSRGLDFLRTNLPNYGWVTLSMSVPDSHLPVFDTGPVKSPDADKDGSQEEDANTPAPKASQALVRVEPARFIDEQYMAQYELQMKMRMQALISEAENYQGYFIVIAQGSSAAVLASLYAKSELKEPEAMVLLSAFMPDVKLTQKMNLDIAQNPIPTLDIYQTLGVSWAAKNIKLRKKLARKHFKVSYRAKELFGDISYHNQNHRLLRSIYGWLSSLGL